MLLVNITHQRPPKQALRTLVVWDEDKFGGANANYPAELFVLAAEHDLPLPIFTIPRDELPPVAADFWLRSGVDSSTVRRFSTQQVIDLKDWTDSPALQIAATQGAQCTLSVRDLIKAYSNTMGGAHRDLAVPVTIHRMSEIIANSRDAIHERLLPAGDLVSSVGRWALEISTEPLVIRRPASK